MVRGARRERENPVADRVAVQELVITQHEDPVGNRFQDQVQARARAGAPLFGQVARLSGAGRITFGNVYDP